MYQLCLGRSVDFASPHLSDILKNMKKSGYTSADCDLCSLRKDPEQEAEALKTCADQLTVFSDSGLNLNGVHISFGKSWDFSAPDESIRKNAVTKLISLFPVVDSFSPVCYVIHGSREPISDEVRPAHIKALKQSLCELMTATKTPIAVETLPRTCLCHTAEEAISIVDAVPGIRICVDVNHFLKSTAEQAVLKLGSRIITTHISDHDYIDERHWLPGKGRIDWMKLLAAFEAIGYNGVFNYEIALEKASSEEIKKNFDEMFQNYNTSISQE